MSIWSWFFKRHRDATACPYDHEGPCSAERRSEERQREETEKHHLRARINESDQRVQWLELQADVESRRQR